MHFWKIALPLLVVGIFLVGVRYYFQANFLCGYGVNLCYEGRSYILFDLVGFPLIMAGAIIIIVEKTTRKTTAVEGNQKEGLKPESHPN